MNTPNPHRHRTSLFIRPVFWLAFTVSSLGCAVLAFSNADRAFSIVELELRMDRDTALAEARRLAESLDLGPTGIRQAARFRVDHTFVYEHTNRQAGEGRYRLTLTVSGDRLTQLTHFLQIPEGFDRGYEEMRSANEGIANGLIV